MATLRGLAKELEDRAAIAATLSLPWSSPGAEAGIGYTIARVQQGWMISRGSDRVALRSTLEDAREQARRLSAFDDVKSQGQA